MYGTIMQYLKNNEYSLGAVKNAKRNIRATSKNYFLKEEQLYWRNKKGQLRKTIDYANSAEV
jgi:hypothetical protein